jgi:hypothetical protein
VSLPVSTARRVLAEISGRLVPAHTTYPLRDGAAHVASTGAAHVAASGPDAGPDAGPGDFRLAPAKGPGLAQVFGSVDPELLYELCPTALHACVLDRVVACRTSALGGAVLYDCPDCPHAHPVYRSCGDRHCPRCQVLKGEGWASSTSKRTLCVAYYHVVLTLHPALRPLARSNQRLLYDLLFAAVKRAVTAAAGRRLDAQLGVTAVLHTWNGKGEYHPHVHALVTAGGLDAGGEWRELPGGRGSLLPLDELRFEARAHFVEGLRELIAKRGLPETEDKDRLWIPPGYDLEAALELAATKRWHVYAKRTLEGAEDAFRYLARYTTRVGVTNSRIEAFDPQTGLVSYRAKHGELLILTAFEVARRFLLHVLPQGFHRIRHFGLFASANGKRKLPLARLAVARSRGLPPPPPPEETTGGVRALLLSLLDLDLDRCPRCGAPLRSTPLPRGADPRAYAAWIRALEAGHT